MKTEAWFLCNADTGVRLIRKQLKTELLSGQKVLLESLYGCLEGNMIHAYNKEPEDVFSLRSENEIVIGNAGVLRVIEAGEEVSDLKKGDLCIYFCNGAPDKYGYPTKITGYDKAGSTGVLARHLVLERYELIKIPGNERISLEQWAMFSLKFVTAWSNWKAAYQTYRVQMPDIPDNEIKVWAWGGGVSYAEMKLARMKGCQAGLITSKKDVMELCRQNGIEVMDRRVRNESPKRFRKEMMEKTGGEGVSIFVDNIGADTYSDTTRLLARQGVIATNGWKDGTTYPVIRAMECINRHIHVHTHYAKYEEGLEAVNFALENDWIPPYTGSVYRFDEIDKLMESYRNGSLSNYFTVFKVNG